MRRRGRKATHSQSIPWSLAVEIAGGVEYLIAGMPRKTWRWWRSEDAVPAYAVVRFLLEHYLAARRRYGTASPSRSHQSALTVSPLATRTENKKSQM